MCNVHRILIFSLFVQIALVVGCQLAHVEIEYVFPDGFRGGAVIRENQPDGVALCRIDAWLPGTHRCTVSMPSSGELKIQGESPDVLWHSASAHYASGKLIPLPNDNPRINDPEATIALWRPGQITPGEVWLFVGTKDECTKFLDEKHKIRYGSQSWILSNPGI
jgi:hypothetical protein